MQKIEINLKNYDAIIFDLDGTILNSSEEVMLCFQEAFTMENFDIEKSRFNSNVIGPPLEDIAKAIEPNLSDEEALKIVANYNQIYDSEKYDCSKMYDGMFDLLNLLKENRKKLFIATNKPTKSTLRLLKKFNLKFFDDIYTLDKLVDRYISKTEMISSIIGNFKLDKAKTIMIGDGKNDILAAHNAGIKGIGVLWGYGDDKEPLKSVSDFVVSNVSELNYNLVKENL